MGRGGGRCGREGCGGGDLGGIEKVVDILDVC